MTYHQHYQPSDFALRRVRSECSPWWLQVVRDVTVTLASVLVSVVLVYLIIAGLRLQSALDDFQTSIDTGGSAPATYVDASAVTR